MLRFGVVALSAAICFSLFVSVAMAQVLGVSGDASVPHNAPVANATGYSRTTLGTFESALQTIAFTSKVTIIAEGAPIEPQLGDTKLDSLVAVLANDNKPSVDMVVETVALAYDYDAEQYDEHTFLLRKRYTDPNDLPCVTYDEVLHSLRQVLRLTGPYAPPVNQLYHESLPEKLYKSLSPQQQEQAQTDGITYDQLTSQQQDLALKTVLDWRIIDPSSYVEAVAYHLSKLTDSQTVFVHEPIQSIRTFGYRGPVVPHDTTGYFPLDRRYHSTYAGAARKLTPLGSSRFEHGAPEPVKGDDPKAENEKYGPDPTLPTPDDERFAPLGIMANHVASTKTLGDFARTLTANAKKNVSSANDAAYVHIAAEPGAAEKPVSVYGTEYDSPETLARAATALYQLEILAPDHKHFNIVLPQARTPKNREDFLPQMRRLIPLPLLRARVAQTAAIIGISQIPLINPRIEHPKAPKVKLGVQERFRRNDARYDSLDVLYFHAARRLLVLAKPLVPTEASPPVPLRSANREVLRLLAIMLYFTSATQGTDDLLRTPLPHIVDNPDSMIVKLRMTKTPTGTILWTSLGYRDDDGVYHAEAAPMIGHQTPPAPMVPKAPVVPATPTAQ